MEPTNDLKETETLADLLDADSTASVEDFIKELEAKEKDLHITADYQIEIEDSDFDEPAVPDFVREDLETFEPEPSPVKAPAAGGQPGLKTRVYELEQEVAKLEARNKELRAERDDIQEKSDRRLKDFEAYKYRMDRERRGSFIDQISNLASQMLPVLDNLDRALDSADNVPEEKRNEFSQFFDGLTLVNQQINEVFAGMGVEPIKSVGEKFDPNFHEAVAVEERDDLPGNTITHEMLRGYRIGNRVVRHSMVKVTTQASGKNAEKGAAEKALHETPAEADNDDTPSTDVLPKDE